MIKNKCGVFCGSVKETEDTWGEYIQHLYEDVNRPKDMNLQIEKEGLNIQMWKLKNAIGNARTNKAAGEDLVPCELIKCLPVQYKKKLLLI